ncbi:putative transcriptional regulator protein [Oceanicola granulosus HTCC2516]|uniref:Putative transcriptional regulator protein n=1 Tax=Oceanicola granulosus (strain ATCC BAA-861 / DSM 15982 / KCTC 12143 / HTCC2516) TaxID=314256 RepID=Q2CHH3_OCEGH|nr:dimethylsulfonioproprionate lyase family protein [Oceanicola granulosus]EAR52066.1 putative transcriptional regulator protein [Oceanicola granulosus HTCC2516]
MTERSPELQSFLAAAETAFRTHAVDDRSRRSIEAGFARLATPGEMSEEPPGRLPVCDRLLPDLLAPGAVKDGLAPLVSAFDGLEPSLTWRGRPGGEGASEGFAEGHANCLAVGPGGRERRTDVWLGASLLAPGTRYPDHDHPPEETYLVLTEGDFWQAGGDWFTPGPGGSFYNPPGIRHAMRSGEAPLLAFWLLVA